MTNIIKPTLRFSLIVALTGRVLTLYIVRQRQGTAEAAIIQATPAAAQFAFQGHHGAPSALGELIFYQWQVPGSSALEMGYISVKRNLLGQWVVGDGGSCGRTVAPEPTAPVTFHAHYLWYIYGYNFTHSYSVVCGRTDSATIYAVAVRWQDGTITTDIVQKNFVPSDQREMWDKPFLGNYTVTNGWFALILPDRQAACQLQLLDEKNAVIRTIDLADIEFVATDATTPLPSCR